MNWLYGLLISAGLVSAQQLDVDQEAWRASMQTTIDQINDRQQEIDNLELLLLQQMRIFCQQTTGPAARPSMVGDELRCVVPRGTGAV